MMLLFAFVCALFGDDRVRWLVYFVFLFLCVSSVRVEGSRGWILKDLKETDAENIGVEFTCCRVQRALHVRFCDGGPLGAFEGHPRRRGGGLRVERMR